MKELKFEWDKGNEHKSVLKHGISNDEAESVFYDSNLVIYSDIKHSIVEKRYICVGKSFLDRILISVFTMRGSKIRIISTRVANKKFRNEYASNR